MGPAITPPSPSSLPTRLFPGIFFGFDGGFRIPDSGPFISPVWVVDWQAAEACSGLAGTARASERPTDKEELFAKRKATE